MERLLLVTKTASRLNWRRVLQVAALLCLLGSTATSCSTFGDFCQAKADCDGGNDADVDACVVDLEAEEERASLYDCDEWFDLYWECAEGAASCESGYYFIDQSACSVEAIDYNGCI